MRILFSSHVFSPSVGGIETVSRLLAREFVRQGHEVRLITQTPGEAQPDETFPVYRRPSPLALLRLVRWCDVFFHNNVSLPRVWPLLLVRRPWVVAHHVWIPESGIAAKAKRRALRYASGISISGAVANHLRTPSVVIGNPYDDSLFRRIEGIEPDRDIAFLGRLVSDKGADLLVSAVAALAQRGLHPKVTVIGEGPEAGALQSQARAAGLADTIDFVGASRGADLVRLLNRHRILVVPSRWSEPFGVVALEGIASGCVVVGSDSGGLRDAIGSCGLTFANGDGEALAARLESLLRDPAKRSALREHAERHLRRHRCDAVAAEYLRVFAHAVGQFASPLRARGASDV